MTQMMPGQDRRYLRREMLAGGGGIMTTTEPSAGPTLRLYQADAVAAIRAAFAQVLRVLFCLPTGGGKTVIFAFIAAHAARKNNRVVVVAHRKEIVDQIS